MIPIYKPYLPKQSLKFAHDALDSTWISSTGKYIELSTEFLKDLLGAKNLKLVNNGTSATHLVVKALLYQNKDIKQVVVPNNVYVAAWNSILYENLNLIPTDADLDTWNVDISKLNDILGTKDPKDTAVMIVPNLGNIINTKKLKRQNPNFLFIEDNCEGFYGKYENAFSGTACLASSLSFFGNKTITSGEGGAFISESDEVFEHINKVQGQGQTSKRYIHDELGYNYRMTNVQAAILYGQLQILNEITEMKQELFNFYKQGLSSVVDSGLLFFQEQEKDTVHSNWMFGLRLSEDCSKIIDYMNERGIDTRPMFYDILKHKHIKQTIKTADITNAEKLQKRCFMIPSYPSITKLERNHIVKTIKDYFLEYR